MNVVTERQVGRDRVPGASEPTRTCARPGCSAPAVATLAFFYGAREVCLERLGLDELPATYDLCSTHADRTRPPYGWVLTDRRTVAKPTEATPEPSEPQDATPSAAGTWWPAPDSSRPLRWLGLAVEATFAFYPARREDFDDSSPAVEPAPDEARSLDPAPDGLRLDPALDEVRLVDPAPDGLRLDPALDEVRLVDPAPYEAPPQEDFVPVRAQSW